MANFGNKQIKFQPAKRPKIVNAEVEFQHTKGHWQLKKNNSKHQMSGISSA